MPKIQLLVTGKRLEKLDQFGKPNYSYKEEEEDAEAGKEIVVDLIPVNGFGEIHIPKKMLGECEIGDKYSFEAPYRNTENQKPNGTY